MTVSTAALSEPAPAGEGLRRAMILFTCVAVTFTYAMAITIVNVSLPQLQGALGASHEQISWVVTLNIVATGIMLPLCGWLVSRFGERAVMVGAMNRIHIRIAHVRGCPTRSRCLSSFGCCRARLARR